MFPASQQPVQGVHYANEDSWICRWAVGSDMPLTRVTQKSSQAALATAKAGVSLC